jgi:hypothetical protein
MGTCGDIARESADENSVLGALSVGAYACLSATGR